MKDLHKAYEPQKYEDGIYKRWEDSGFFAPDVCIEKGVDKKNAPYFSIVLPPPNVTGTLHMGHAAMLAIQDVMIRYHRMKGDRTLWVPGTDHAAIATQTKVEKILLEKEGKTRHDLGREKFLKRVYEFAQKSHDTIVNQSKKMGASLDWGREAFTLDEKRNLAVRTVFKKMYDDGLIYRGDRIVNWCPRCHSTLADDEVEYKEEDGKFYWIKYGPFVLATARPETKLGDTAVAVHPDDERYKDMVGKKYMIPGVLGEFEIEVVADDAVDPEFGTGAVKVTPAHSFVDNEIAKRHSLPLKKIIDEDGLMMDNCGKYKGMTTKEARKAVVADMEKMGLIDHIEDNYRHNISTCYRCGTTIEPLTSKQWFVDVNKKFKLENSKLKGIKSGQKVSLKELMQKVVKSKQIEIIPDRFEKTYFHWIDNLRDWCISRQIWYGHRIPVYYCEKFRANSSEPIGCNEPIVGVEELKECPNCGGEVEQDSDTLDTWFSSGLWTFSTLGYPDLEAPDMQYHPTSVMETGYDILFFWVARMILMTTYTLGDIPFEKVYLHGMVRDAQGRKMSKSLGNTIDPLDMIKKYGTDATRLSLLLGNTPGNDMKLSEAKVEGFRNFANKLWNISRFIIMQINNKQLTINNKIPKGKTLADEWILEGLENIQSLVEDSVLKYSFSFAGENLRDFTWGDLADWYLEITKAEGDKSEILNYILNTILKLWHPFMPFVTETIWQEIYGKENILMVEKWPSSKNKPGEQNRTKINIDFLYIKEIIMGIRSLRADYKVEPAKKLDVYIYGKDVKPVKENSEIISLLARVDKLNIGNEKKKIEKSVSFVAGKYEVSIDLAGAIDFEKEKARLQKEIEKIEPYVKSLTKKLLNKKFTNSAPAKIVEAEKKKLEQAKEKLEKLQQQLKQFPPEADQLPAGTTSN